MPAKSGLVQAKGSGVIMGWGIMLTGLSDFFKMTA